MLFVKSSVTSKQNCLICEAVAGELQRTDTEVRNLSASIARIEQENQAWVPSRSQGRSQGQSQGKARARARPEPGQGQSQRATEPESQRAREPESHQAATLAQLPLRTSCHDLRMEVVRERVVRDQQNTHA